ncbi:MULTISPECIES: 2-oxo acid dehydrogenase subunit E2 [Acinetobacter]|jgi:pyruvate dehydrogenase E2 component (dihydrolipoamide acetyltransferase)|uniref:Dihydrolipoamide acetyltransferase component of pyruvate dehydrogenase complex n=1 Tax=Acinetobacter junii TaxID=40215 RepID=A0AAW5RE35_ACIJU|nr:MULTISPECIES: 2-oxo acid dehydrogenase subunit E2 [Acinetobacter]MBY3626470.1 pyruvate dehydrogenase complex dihydrolipoyllysine-residue acetyltransferase [Acinetobacter sp. CUI P1]MCU4397576.1 2-oxo acid dehydrogenase subunit E2 [Acinetobacter junii]MDA3502899.1 2-oxo acid dehydrogenase subunit E2 [Acinetobacter sp. AOR34_HL]MDH1006529.1 2-oxo acid dehydrogenase subunit E2 [Acinetobacter junii]MDH1377305.1 2-oxo acid dehydrogenase subunit E2 [Acinetobacter junii]
MQIQAPDIGVDKALVAEILVKIGDRVAVEDSLLVLESDKATVEVPSTAAGIVKSILVKQGDEVTEGVALVELEAESQATESRVVETAQVETPKVETQSEQIETPSAPVVNQSATSTQVVDVKVPDIGVEKALVAEVLVKVGDEIEVEQSIVVVESDKATVEVPSSVAGVVEAIQIKEGDSIKEGVVLIQVKTASAVVPSEPQVAPAQTVATTEALAATNSSTGNVEIEVPDLGVEKALVSEILVNVGDRVKAQQSLCVVESDKASVEVPSSVAGIVRAIHVSANQEVRQGMGLATIEVSGQAAAQVAPKTQPTATEAAPVKPQTVATAAPSAPAQAEKLTKEQEADNAKVYAGPAVRKLARELGVVLGQVKASGEHGRVMKDDVFAYVKTRLTAPQAAPSTQAAPVASGLPSLPDFTAFGGGEVKAMTRLQQVSVPQLSLNNFIPQVTQFDLADITELEAWRGELKDGFKKQGISLTILAFIAKAVAHLLKEEPYFAGHLADDQKSVLLRNEIHMGIAVATPDGLTVPVLRNPDQKSIKQIAMELAELSQKARDRKLSPKDLQGANFTITSLGSIGGTAFTPLVNWPQVAILGISPATMQPVWNGKDFDPRLMLPLSLSYDHRVINGADAARFTNKLTKLLKDIRSLLL